MATPFLFKLGRVQFGMVFLLFSSALSVSCSGSVEAPSETENSAVSTTGLPDMEADEDASSASQTEPDSPNEPVVDSEISSLTVGLAGANVQMESVTFALSGGVVTTATQSTSPQWNLVGGM